MNKLLKIYSKSVLTLILLAGLFNGISAQRLYNGRIIFTPYALEQRGDSLLLDVMLDFQGLLIDNDRSLVLTPVLSNDRQMLEFPEILINGKGRHKAYARKQSLRKKYDRLSDQPYAAIRSNRYMMEKLRYRVSVPFEAWMEGARLDLKEDLCGCAGYTQQISIEKMFSEVMLEVAEPYLVQTRVVYIRPRVEEVKARSEEKEAFLDFPVGKTYIQPSYRNNPVELMKIEKMIREVSEDRNRNVTGILIRGFASPEGSLGLNERLSWERAESLRSYLAGRTFFHPSSYRVEKGGEDWEGLAELLSDSNIPHDKELISIIRSSLYPEERKKRLQTYAGGIPYKRMLNEIYPRLRRVVCKVEFTVKGFSTEEAKEVFKTNPHLLSLEEMFLVANSYPVESKEYNHVFETAVRMYPNDPVANHNAAAMALQQGNPERAGRYLELSRKDSPHYYNNMGVYYLLKEEYDQSRFFLQKAKEGGIKSAGHNLAELERKIESVNKINKRK